ncbi:MAG: ATP-dependent helicase [Patescibacteria group bacterium]|nr:ATP-dependent helicase [Patescibacteria group bacterium]
MSDEAFQRLYKKLDPAQREAVDAIEGPVMVIAGPGTGKTTILTLRIANILRLTDTPPHGILAITYTDAGVKAMRAKLRDIIGSRAHEVAIHTFHSFASAMIAEYPDHFLHLQGFRNMTDVEQESLVRSIVAGPSFERLRPLGKPDAYVAAIMRAIDDAKREALTPDMVKAHALKEAERIKSDESSISTRGATKGMLKADAQEAVAKCERTALFADAYARYEEEKRASKRMDFNDLIIELLVALREDQLFLRLVQERFLSLLVDEHQDTNDAQNFIVGLIAEFFETPNLFIVGDEKQAIYRFQGASVENFLMLQKRWPAMKVISLGTNYRSHQGILDASFAMIEHNYGEGEHEGLRIELESGSGEERRPVAVVTGENASAAEGYLVSELEALSEREPASTVAIITRRNRDLERVIRLLEAHGIPVSSERSVDIFHHPVGAAFFRLLEYLKDPSRADALAATLAAGMWGLPFDRAAEAIRSLRSGMAGAADAVPALLHLRRKMLNDAPVGFVIEAAEMSGFTALVARDPAYVHVWRGIVALAESLARESSIRSPEELIGAMLDYRLSAESKTVKVSVGAPDLPIRAMTAHGSKGLEFDHVYIPYATEEAWVGRARGTSFILPKKRSDDHDIRDVRRLFYVALTRARKHAVVIAALEESDGASLTPLRFIAELDPESVEETSVPRAAAPATPAASAGAPGAESRRYADALVGLAKETLLGSGLSVTALNHFIECPNKFLYESILKLPQAPSASAEKGTAMHEAMAAVWRSPERNAARIEALIVSSVKERLEKSFLPAADKAAVEKELLGAARAVAIALEPHFARTGAVHAERWAEAVFDGSFGGRRVAVPIHGKLDAVADDGAGGVTVFDYKTRQSMSPAEIKGETKGSSGGYFRQLAFYRLLIDSDPRWRGRRAETALVFVSPDKKGRCPIVPMPVEEGDIAALKAGIQAVIDAVWSGSIASASCGERDCMWCGLRKAAG